MGDVPAVEIPPPSGSADSGRNRGQTGAIGSRKEKNSSQTASLPMRTRKKFPANYRKFTFDDLIGTSPIVKAVSNFAWLPDGSGIISKTDEYKVRGEAWNFLERGVPYGVACNKKVSFYIFGGHYALNF